jgi:hypothetical protein
MATTTRARIAYNASLDEILSMVLRHMVMAHDVSLNVRKEDAGGTAPVQAVD